MLAAAFRLKAEATHSCGSHAFLQTEATHSVQIGSHAFSYRLWLPATATHFRTVASGFSRKAAVGRRLKELRGQRLPTPADASICLAATLTLRPLMDSYS